MTCPSPIRGALKMLALALASILSLTIASALPTSGAYAAVACPTVADDGTTTPEPVPEDNLSGCNLSGAKLDGIDLTRVDLTDANLTDADLTDANLTDADLTDANLTNAILVRATITRTEFLNAIFTGIRGEDLRGDEPKSLPNDSWRLTAKAFIGPGADLSETSLNEANLSNANLSNANLSNANLTDANLTDANLTNANMAGSDLTRTILTGAILTGVNFSTTRVYETIVSSDMDTLTYTGAGSDHTGDLAVVGASSLTPVIPATALGRSVTSVGEYAFCVDDTEEPCDKAPITSINLGSVDAIDVFAFTKTPLESIDLTPVRSIGNWAFARTELQTLDLKNVRFIGENAFAEITTLSVNNLSIPATVERLGGSAFRETSFGGSLTLGTGLAFIGAGAFKDSDFSGSLVIPASVTSIGEEVFVGNKFTSISFAVGSLLTSIPNEFVSGMDSLSGTLHIPAGVTSIGVDAFYETSVTSTTFPSSLTSIGDRAFSPQRQNRTFTFEGAAPAFGSQSFEIAEDTDNRGVITVRYPRGALGWAGIRTMNPNPFGENVTWVEYVFPTPANGGGGDGSQPSPSSPPTTPPAATEQVGVPTVLPSASQQPGTTTMLIGGQSVTVQDQPLRRGQGLSLSAGPVSMTLRGTTSSGQAIPLASDGSLLLARSGALPINISGLAPGSVVTQTLFSDPIPLGTATADAAGELASTVTIPATVSLGSHTLRLQGTTNTGEGFALDVGVTVATPVVALGANPILTVKQKTLKGKRTLDVRAQGVQSRCLVTFTAGKRKAKARADRSGKARAQFVVPEKSKRAVNITARISGKGCAPVQVTRRT